MEEKTIIIFESTRWWKIKDIETGEIDFRKIQLGKKSSNEKSEGIYIGDYPAKIMEKAIAEISAVYEEELNRPSAKKELEAYFNFAINPGGVDKHKKKRRG